MNLNMCTGCPTKRSENVQSYDIISFLFLQMFGKPQNQALTIRIRMNRMHEHVLRLS